MSALNYQGSSHRSQALAILFSLILILGGVFCANKFARAGCSEIQDLDDRLKCYSDKQEKKEEEYESVEKKLSDLRGQKDAVQQKISSYLGELSVTQSEINSLQNDINNMEQQLEEINTNLTTRRDALQDKIILRNKVIRKYYQSGILTPLEFFFVNMQAGTGMNGFRHATFSYLFEKSFNSDTVKVIGALNTDINSYEKDKKEAESLKGELESAQSELLALKTQIDNKRLAAESELGVLSDKESSYSSELADLQAEIDELSDKQQSILKQKYGDEYGSLGNYQPPEYKLPDPPFSPAYAAMSYGAYTHYKGMSQYGAKGRAEDGKDYKDIIEFYYDEDVDEKDGFPDKIKVQGYGEMDFQDYLYGLAEMPSDWPKEALRAQAVAARSYAYNVMQGSAYANDGGICTSQSCQVFLKSKADNPPDKWKDAVDDTKDEIIGGDKGASGYGWYSSTTGGYIDNVGWDADGDWPGGAYEKKAKSPWFYRAWYTQSYSDSSSTCGRSTPWLNKEEMADILNAIVVWKKGSSSDRQHISPVTTSCWGGDPYSIDKMAGKADDLDKNFGRVNDIDVTIGNNGKTTNVHFSTDNGSMDVDGDTFKTVFNLRAPAYVAIRSRLYDIEMKD